MLDELKQEFKVGKKVYLFEIISLILFTVFLGVTGTMIDTLTPELMSVTNIVLLGWLVINLIVITIYVLYTFVKLIFKDMPLSGSLQRTILYKVMIFLMFFSVNGFIFLQMVSMAVPMIALGLAFLVITFCKDMFPSQKGLIVLGVIWFITLMTLLMIVYPFVFVLIAQVITNFTLLQFVMNVLMIAIAALVYYGVIKKCLIIYQAK